MKRLLFILLILLSACAKEIEIEQVDYTPKIAIDGWIEAGRAAKVYVSRSSPYLTNYDSASIMATIINHAKVTVTCSDGDSEILTLFKDNDFFPPFVYRTVRLKGESGKAYHLTVEVENKLIEASTTIPAPPVVVTIKMDSISDSTQMANAIIEAPQGKSHYYSQIKLIAYDNNLHPSANPLIKIDKAEQSLYSFDILRKNEPDPLHLKPEYNIPMPVHEYLNTQAVLVCISTIDEASYAVLNNLFMDQINANNPFSFTNNKTATNIEGGIGHWTGLASYRKVLNLKQSSLVSY